MALTPEELTEAKKIVSELKLSDEKKKAYDADPDLLEVMFHQVNQKRSANSEAKGYREQLDAKKKADEKAAEDQKAKDAEALKKKGDFEKLYNKSKEDLESEKKKTKDLIIKKEVEILAVQEGIKKREYIGLFITVDLEVDDKGEIKGIKEKFDEWKKANPDLFGEPKKIDVDKTKAGGEGDAKTATDEELERLKQEAQTGNTEKVAKYQMAVREREKAKIKK